MDAVALRRVWLFAVCLATAISASPASQPRAPAEMLDDAALNDVFFLDPDRGWAVGDRGAIWRTEDGGRQWQLQDAPIACPLHGVYFADGENGWAVGGWTHPYTHKTSAEVLRTQDGGQTWKQLPTSAIPTLRRIRMVDAKTGWAVGAASALFPSGVFRTEDGGRGWTSIGGDEPAGWQTGDFRAGGGVIAGRAGVALAGANRFRIATAEFGGRTIRQLRLAEGNAAWLVGDAGLVRQSLNGGATWSAPAGALPSQLVEAFDFHALAVIGPHAWITGAPGTLVFHSADGGATWESSSTDQALPLRAVFFLDENHGWAVGELGVVLATRDGGRTWLRQRGAATRLAVLGFYSDAVKTPWELFVRLGGNEGYLTGAEYMSQPEGDSTQPSESPEEDRVREAMLAAGGCTSNESSASIGLEERIVRKIRQWRPSLIVTQGAEERPGDTQGAVFNRAVVSAVAAAADPSAFPEHATELGLAPWTVQKVYAPPRAGGSGQVTIVAASLAPRIGGTLGDAGAAARALLDSEFVDFPAKVDFELLMDRTTNDSARGGDLMAGIDLRFGGEARRRLTDLSPGNLDLVAKTAQKQRNIQQILSRGVEQSSAAVLGQVDELTRDFSETAAGDLLFQLAERLRRSGHGDLAAEVYHRLLQRHPKHAASEAAALRLTQWWASGEAAAQQPKRAEIRRGVGEGVRLATFDEPVESENEDPAGVQAARGATMHVRGGSATSTEADRRERDSRAVDLGQAIARFHPALYAEPALRFSLASAARRQGNPREGERYFGQLLTRNESNPWRKCAEGELWFMKPMNDPPKDLVNCASARERPFLDGKLDEAAWRDVAPVELTSRPSAIDSARVAEGDSPASALLTHDDEFLYIALRCRKSSAVSYVGGGGPRTYDAPLESHDRVDLLLDLDRDYATYYRFTVDHRGWTGEACAGDVSWNPVWFVVADSDETTWTIEAAIPWAALASHTPRPRDVWAMGIQRTVPGAGFQSWTLPASPQVRPEGFGYLLFE